MSKISVQDFKRTLRDEMSKIYEEKRWNDNVETQRGWAFQLWCARTYANYDQEMETSPDDAMLGASDLKADMVFEDSTRKHLMIAQCKYASLASPKDVDETEVNDFFNRHTRYLDRRWVREHGSDRAVELLIDYEERMRAGWRATFCFFTTANASDRVRELVEGVNDQYSRQGALVECMLYDFSLLKDFYVRSLSLEESIPEKITLQIRKGQWIVKDDPYRTLIAVVKGNALRALYQQHKEALFAYNIRGYLGDRGINADIRQTAEQQPEVFFYFNNGVSAICTEIEFDEKSGNLVATKFQVINGAQTIGALRQAKEDSQVEVLLRVTKTLSVATEKGFNADIIKYNNSQNVVKVSDFRANDPIQLWLEQRFSDYKGEFRKTLPELVYVRKRGVKKRGRYTGVGVKLEDAAKIRFAFIAEPTRVLESPKDMWTSKGDGGVYESAFGVNGELVEKWTDEVFEEYLLAQALFIYLEEETKKEGQQPDLKSFGRLKYHALSLAGIYYRAMDQKISPRKLLSSKESFDRFIEAFWPDARRVLIDAYMNAVEGEKSTPTAMARNIDQWEKIRRRFMLYKKIGQSQK